MTLIVIFGAGASFDVAQGDSIWNVVSPEELPTWPPASPREFRPPLTPALFSGKLVDQLLHRYPAASHLVHEARMLVSRDAGSFAVEQFLQRFSESNVREDTRAVLAARYLLRDYLWACTDYALSRFGPGHANNYAGLLGRLNRWCRKRNEPLAVVSFNYDLLADRAFENVMNKRLETLDWYVSDSDRLLVKPHGSCNWSRPLHLESPVVTSRNYVSSATRALLEWNWSEDSNAPIALVPNLYKSPVPVGPTVPALALPVVGKTGPVCPDEHLKALATTLDGPVSILTVGWRGADEWFIDFLGAHINSRTVRGLISMGGLYSHAQENGHRLAGNIQNQIRGFQPVLQLDGFNSLQTSPELAEFLGDS